MRRFAPAPGSRAELAATSLAGAVAVGGFAPFGLPALAVVTAALLLWLWQRAATPRRAGLLGFAFGAGHFLAGVSWVYVSLHVFGMMPAPLAALATLLFCLFLALFPAAAGYLAKRLAPGRLILVAAPGLWVLAEWVRSWIFTGFPWLAIGYSQIDSPLAGFAPLAGVHAVSLATMACAALAVLVVGGSRTARSAGLIGILVLAAGGFGLGRVEWTGANGRTLTVALLQGNIPQSMKFDPARYRATLETYARLVERAHAKLVVLPETAIPRFLDLVDPAYIERLRETAAARGADLLIGAPLRDAEGRYYNSVISLGTSPAQTYSKSHLVPFGEFIPPGFAWVLGILNIPLSDFSRGSTTQKPLAIAGERVAPNICYEDAFGEEIIRMLPEATVLVNVSNVAWFGDSLAPAQHLEISRMRALETGRAMLRATNTGVTAIIDHRGRVVAQLPKFTEGVLSGEVRARDGATPYVRFVNVPALAVAAVLALVPTLLRGRTRRAGG